MWDNPTNAERAREKFGIKTQICDTYAFMNTAPYELHPTTHLLTNQSNDLSITAPPSTSRTPLIHSPFVLGDFILLALLNSIQSGFILFHKVHFTSWTIRKKFPYKKDSGSMNLILDYMQNFFSLLT